jgi:transport and Golgi organization protein 2
MCTVLLRFAPGTRWPVLVAAVRDEFIDRPWDPPAEHWPGYVGGRDRVGGGTWLAVAPAGPTLSALLNGGSPIPLPGGEVRPSRGALPLGPLPDDLRQFDRFHLVRAGLAMVEVVSWDGCTVTRRSLAPGDHVVVNQGVDVNDLPALRDAGTPDPVPGRSTEDAWGDWVELLAGGGFTGVEPRPLIVRREFDGRRYGSGSATLVALSATGIRYDFTANPGESAIWREIQS